MLLKLDKAWYNNSCKMDRVPYFHTKWKILSNPSKVRKLSLILKEVHFPIDLKIKGYTKGYRRKRGQISSEVDRL